MRSGRSLCMLAALALAGCATLSEPTRLLGLPSVDQAAFDSCRQPVESKTCGGRPDAAACWEEVKASYQALPSQLARKRYLVDSGCPLPTVEAWLPDSR